jgi:hypothetical protein
MKTEHSRCYIKYDLKKGMSSAINKILGCVVVYYLKHLSALNRNASRRYIVKGGLITPCIPKPFPFKSTLFYINSGKRRGDPCNNYKFIDFGLISSVQGPLVQHMVKWVRQLIRIPTTPAPLSALLQNLLH